MLKNQLRKLQENTRAPMPLPLPSELQLATCHYSIHIVYKCCCIYCDMHKRLGKCLDKIARVVLCSRVQTLWLPLEALYAQIKRKR